jgi:hypothetical protein
MICEVLDHIEDRLEDGISLLLFEDKAADGSAIIIVPIHHRYMNKSILFVTFARLQLNFDHRHSHVSVMVDA